MLVAGIGLTSFGLFRLIFLYMEIQKVENNPFFRLNEDAAITSATIGIVALVAGLVLIFIAISKSRNDSALDKLINTEKMSLNQTVCKNCGLNLSEGTTVCPKCNTYQNFNQ